MKVNRLPLPPEAIAAFKRKLEAQKRANAEMQRYYTMTPDQRMRRALDRIVANRKMFNDFHTGRDTTEEQARKDLENVIKRYTRDRNIE